MIALFLFDEVRLEIEGPPGMKDKERLVYMEGVACRSSYEALVEDLRNSCC